MRITAACPESLLYQSNNLAMVLAYSQADADTYKHLNWEDAQGNLYACASWESDPDFVIKATSPLVRPEWDAEQIIDMAAAEQAQAALVFSEGGSPKATPTTLTAIGGMNGKDALMVMGLTLVPRDIEEA